MFALVKRNIKIYFSSIPSVLMSLLGALIAFFIYIGFLQKNLESSWSQVANAKQMLDLWMMAGIIAIAGITTSFQALGQLVKDRETRTADDMRLTDLSLSKQNLAYVLSSSIISFLMQIIIFVVMDVYFTIVDKINISLENSLVALIFMALGAIGATLLNEIIVLFIHSSTTFSRLSAVIGAIAGFAVATYMPYGTLSSTAQNLVKLVPSSYEASALRSLFLNKISEGQMPASVRSTMIKYLGIHFKINGFQLTRADTAYVMIGMILLLSIVIVLTSLAIGKRKVQVEG
ncbi:ABC transporter permease [Lactobacillus intestinalis]|uniref:ABC transporter permease n=1 Tax=Lactobacillus intestinalis TaxID=151781 RepID=UPI001F5922CA|nr:ABC transporter permease [Lactobacillus intestinalis]